MLAAVPTSEAVVVEVGAAGPTAAEAAVLAAVAGAGPRPAELSARALAADAATAQGDSFELAARAHDESLKGTVAS